jgi:hypothetical protein
MLITTALAATVGQTFQISTRFSNVYGKPIWLFIVREVETGKVRPYIFDITQRNNFWIAFTEGHSYRITVSELKFGPYAKIHNFCRLQNGILTGKSMTINITGELSPNPRSFKCNVIKFQDGIIP